MIQTNWIIFSGVTSAGKTTIADRLVRYGFKAPIEVARVYIDELRAGGMTQDALSDHVKTYAFQHEVAQRSLMFEKSLGPNDRVIIDCGLIGTYAYFRQRGHTEHLLESGDNIPLKAHLDTNRYRGIFLFEKLPCDGDLSRFGTRDDQRDEAHRLLEETNAYQGYTSTVVPVGSVVDRLQFILEKLTEMIPCLMVDAGLKPPSGRDRIKPDSFETNNPAQSANTCTTGLKLYSGSYSSLFYSRGANITPSQNNMTITTRTY